MELENGIGKHLLSEVYVRCFKVELVWIPSTFLNHYNIMTKLRILINFCSCIVSLGIKLSLKRDDKCLIPILLKRLKGAASVRSPSLPVSRYEGLHKRLYNSEDLESGQVLRFKDTQASICATIPQRSSRYAASSTGSRLSPDP
jgi:hypothetical protein